MGVLSAGIPICNKVSMKRATTIEEQIILLKDRGMTIENEEKAKEILLDIGYYRLGFYWFPFEKTYPQKGEKRSHEFVEDTSFNDAVDLYYFDHDLRNILLSYLCRIEINLRTFVIYHISHIYKNNPLWFVDSSALDKNFVTYFQKTYLDNIRNNATIKHHHRKYPQDLMAPAWKTLEYATFGDIIMLCRSLKDNNLQKDIAEHYDIRNLEVFYNYIGTVRVLRNLCAHGHNIFDLKLQKSIKTGPIANVQGNEHHNLSGALKVLLFLLSKISIHRELDLRMEILELLGKNQNKNIYPIISYLLPVTYQK